MSERPTPEQEREEFARAVPDVVPLAPDPRGRAERPAPPPVIAMASQAPPEPGPAPEDYVAPGVSRREILELRRGQHQVRARLDLHGLTIAEARRKVGQFIENCRHGRHRCVCIIHGKGLNSAGGVSLLRQPVRDILVRTPAVLAYASAPASDGGTGSVYVLLRR